MRSQPRITIPTGATSITVGGWPVSVTLAGQTRHNSGQLQLALFRIPAA